MNEARHSADALREAFDLVFSAPRADEALPGEPVLRLRVGEAPCAVRLSQLSGVHAARGLLTTPGGMHPVGWMGLAGLRSRLVAVYDLAALMGLPSAAATARWLAISRDEPTLALAFEHLDGMHVAPPGMIRPAPRPDEAAPERLIVDGEAHALLHLPHLIAIVKRVADRHGAHEEPSP